MDATEFDRLAKAVAKTSNVLATDFLSVFGRLKEATGARTDTELAKLIGLRQSTISAAKSKKEIPPGWIIDIASKFGVSSDWLLFGSGPKKRGEAQIPPAEAQGFEASQPFVREQDAEEHGLTMVPKVRARLNAGTGSLETSADVEGLYAFRTKFLRRKGTPRKMVLMEITGDSMEPELKECDTVLIDESQTDIIAGGLFAVGVEKEVFVKYVDREPGMLILRSRNERYKPIEVPMSGDLAETVRIIGRVVWSCREYGG